MLKCPCGLVHVKQTQRALKIFTSEYKTATPTQSMDYTIAGHNMQTNHGSAASLKFWGIGIKSPSTTLYLEVVTSSALLHVLDSHSEHDGALWHK